jgi:hypothetical protein
MSMIKALTTYTNPARLHIFSTPTCDSSPPPILHPPQAFVKLESLPSIPEARRAAFAEVALGIFTAHAPADPVTLKEAVAGGGGGGGGARRHDALLSDLEGASRDQVRACVCCYF